MKGHATPSTLSKHLEGSLEPADSARILRHLDDCAACRGRYRVLEAIGAPSTDRVPAPGRDLYRRIMSAYDRTAAETASTSPARIAHFFQYRWTAIAAALIVGIASTLIIYGQYRFERAPVKAARVEGTVKANRIFLKKGQTLQSGDLLTTGENSRLGLVYGKIMKIVAGSDTVLYIKKSRIDRKTGKIIFELMLDRGTIVAIFDSSGNLEYTVKTPHGLVSSKGSKIVMKVNPSGTRVMVREGIANVSTHTPSKAVNAEEGSGYTITDKQVLTADTPDDDSADGISVHEDEANDLLDSDDGHVIQ